VRSTVILALGLLMAVAGAPGPAFGQETLFQEGNARYQQGDFEAAAAAYEEIIQAGWESSELYYNLGNARFRLDDLPRAVLYYEKALRLDRGNDDAAANLALVRQRLPDRIEPLPRFWLLMFADRWINLLPQHWLIVLTAGAWGLGGVAASSLILRRPRGWIRGMRRLVLACLALTGVLGGTLFLRTTRFGAPEEAVVMASEVSVLSAPSSDGGLVLFSLHGGTKVRIDQRSGDWVEVVLEDGKVGWLRSEVLETI